MFVLLWLVGLLPVIYDLAARVWWRHEPWDLVQNVVRRAYVIAPWCMLVLHIVFWREAARYALTGADLAPALLGLAAVSGRFNFKPQWRTAIRFVPAIALLITLFLPDEEMRWMVRIGAEMKTVTAVHFMLAGTILTYGYMGTLWHLVAASGTVLATGLGYIFMAWISEGMRLGMRTAGGLIPTTALTWGITTIGAAFVLLGVGTWLSLRRTKEAEAKKATG
jgi:hypothetical protein